MKLHFLITCSSAIAGTLLMISGSLIQASFIVPSIHGGIDIFYLPNTLQVITLLLIALVVGPRSAALSSLIYLSLGLMQLPIFTVGGNSSYIHTGARVGVLVEVNCETDFVARGEIFQELLRNVAMQIAACPNVEYVTTEEIPDEVINREKSIEMGRDDLDGKPTQMKEKIVEGRINKRLKELALLEQPFIKDSSVTVAEMVKQVVGKIGENIQVRRFTRYNLGEGIEVKKVDFAAEVAAM